MTATAIGIDVGADVCWAVAVTVDERPAVVATLLSHPVDLEQVIRFTAESESVAIDAPAEPSDTPHAEDLRLPPKFRGARCGEVALHRRGISVPWVTPIRDSALPPWIATGYRLWEELRLAGPTPVETYPHGIFWRLAGTPLIRKQQPAGHLRRAETLRQLLEAPPQLEMWSHDALDALAAAYLAALVARGDAECVDCSADADWPSHDPSSIWLPKPRSELLLPRG